MYQNQHAVRRAVAEVAGLQIEEVFLTFNGTDFDLALPDGVTWEDREPQPDLEIPQVDGEGNPLPPILQSQPDIVTPKPIWDWYRQQYDGVSEEPPSAEAVAAWEVPEQEQPQNPVTDVEKYKEVFVGARRNATLLVDTIKATVQDALVKSGAYSASEATIQGVDFVFYHGNDIANYKEAGGHPSAAARLLAAFKSAESAALFPWVKSVESVFDGALTY